jgi:hypothetical protein
MKQTASRASCWFLAWLIFQPGNWRRHVPPKSRLTFNGLYDVVSQKVEEFFVDKDELFLKYTVVTIIKLLILGITLIEQITERAGVAVTL